MFGSLLGKLMQGAPSSSESSPETESELEVLASIERSRKRHLSPGIIRGDRISDLLVEQEATASPVLKKSTPAESQERSPDSQGESAAGMSFTWETFEKYMDKNVTKKLDKLENLEEGVSELKNSVGKLGKAVKNNATKIDKHAALIKANAEAILELKDGIKRPESPQNNGGRTYARVVENGQDDLEYAKARRSLRIWPITGNTQQEIWRCTGIFLRETLALEALTENKIEEISRPRFPSGFGVQDEVLIRFADNEIRDSVLGQSGKLADKFNAEGKPTAGIRLEITKNLIPVFKTLEKFGQQLRARHGQGTRRHVKFDDIDQTLYLNIKLPGDIKWSKVTLDMARRGVKAREKLASEELEKRLDMESKSADDQPPQGTTGGAPMDTNWTGESSARQ